MEGEDMNKELWSGELTKRGRKVKNWKRRVFVLASNGMLEYFKDAEKKQKAGSVNVGMCTAVVSGGYSAGVFPPQAKNLSFSIVCPDRTLFVYADDEDSLGSWLKALRVVVPKGASVPTLEDVLASAELAAKGATPITTAEMTTPEDPPLPPRVTVAPNGNCLGGFVISLPPTLDEFKKAAAQALSISVERMFTPQGGEITDISFIKDNERVYVSEGEDYIWPYRKVAQYVKEQVKPELMIAEPIDDDADYIYALSEDDQSDVDDGIDYLHISDDPIDKGYMVPDGTAAEGSGAKVNAAVEDYLGLGVDTSDLEALAKDLGDVGPEGETSSASVPADVGYAEIETPEQ